MSKGIRYRLAGKRKNTQTQNPEIVCGSRIIEGLPCSILACEGRLLSPVSRYYLKRVE